MLKKRAQSVMEVPLIPIHSFVRLLRHPHLHLLTQLLLLGPVRLCEGAFEIGGRRIEGGVCPNCNAYGLFGEFEVLNCDH